MVDPVEANKKRLDILMKGIDSLSFRIDSKDLKAEVIENSVEGYLRRERRTELLNLPTTCGRAGSTSVALFREERL